MRRSQGRDFPFRKRSLPSLSREVNVRSMSGGCEVDVVWMWMEHKGQKRKLLLAEDGTVYKVKRSKLENNVEAGQYV